MAIKVDGTNNKVIFYAGSPNATSLAGSLTATPWTMTLPPDPGTAGQVLATDGFGNLSWSAGGGGITITDDTATNAARYPLFSSIVTGSLTTAYVASTEYQFNPAQGVLSAPRMESTQGMHLNADTITASYTLPAGFNALSAGPITEPAGVIVTVPTGQSWVVV